MRVCLINPLSQANLWEGEIASHEPPLGLCYLASVLEKNGHKVKIIERRRFIGNRRRNEANLNALDREIYKQIKSFNPAFVGITATTPLIMDAYRLTRVVKQADDNIKIMAGGCHPTARPKRVLEDSSEIDAVCIGEGEFVFLEFVQGRPLDQIKGIAYRNDGEIAFTQQRDFYQDIDDLPFPSRHLLDRKHYFSAQSTTIRGNHLAATTVLTARGCPYKCVFCQAGFLAKSGKGRFVRFRSPASVIEEIKRLIKDFAIGGIFFAEDMFSLELKNVFNLCELFIKAGLNKKIEWAANLRVDAAKPGLLKLMKQAGCIQVIYGCESGSQDILDRLEKRASVEQNYKAVEITKKAGLFCEVNVMMGLPQETEGDFLKTIEFLKRAKPDRIVKSKLYPLPGTPLYEDLKSKNIIKEPDNWNDLWDIYVNADFTFADMRYEKFIKLCLRLDREVIYRRNYINEIKNIMKKSFILGVVKIFTMVFHLFILYLPVSAQKILQRFIDSLKARFL